MSYEAFVTKNQIERLGLKNTMFASGLAKMKQEAVEKNENKHEKFLRERPYIDPTEMATGYTAKEGKLTPVPRNSQSAWSANGAVLASAEDISLWDIGLAGSLLVSRKENRDFLYHGIKLNDGAEVPAHAGGASRHKGLMDIRGNVPGFSCYLSPFTDKSELLCVTLCANKGGVDLAELARRIAGAFDRKLGPPSGPKGDEVPGELLSGRDDGRTARRVPQVERRRGRGAIDHAAAAKKKGLELRPTVVLVFGNPAVGTQLMLSRPSVALDLPLRVVVWQEADGTVWVGYRDVADLARQHGITDRANVIASMRTALEAAVKQATTPY